MGTQECTHTCEYPEVAFNRGHFQHGRLWPNEEADIACGIVQELLSRLAMGFQVWALKQPEVNVSLVFRAFGEL